MNYSEKQIDKAAADSRLTDKSIRVAKLVMCQGMTYQEAANTFNITKQQVFAICKNLKKRLPKPETVE